MPFDDNQCIQNLVIDEVPEQHDIRTGGADGSAGDGIYGGVDGTEMVPLDRVNYMRELPCGPLDIKAIRTLLYWAFKRIDELCAKVSAIACQFSIDTLGANETVEGVLTKVVDDDGNCRTALMPLPEEQVIPNSFNFSFANLWATGEVALPATTQNFVANIAANAIPNTAIGYIIRVEFEIDSGDDGLPAVGATISVNNQMLGNAETGGASGAGDNNWVGDFHIPRNNGNLITATVTRNFDVFNIGAFQTRGRLIGWF